jgi:hypothetical protein
MFDSIKTSEEADKFKRVINNVVDDIKSVERDDVKEVV